MQLIQKGQECHSGDTYARCVHVRGVLWLVEVRGSVWAKWVVERMQAKGMRYTLCPQRLSDSALLYQSRAGPDCCLIACWALPGVVCGLCGVGAVGTKSGAKACLLD